MHLLHLAHDILLHGDFQSAVITNLVTHQRICMSYIFHISFKFFITIHHELGRINGIL